MPNLKDIIWVEKYRPSKFEDLICQSKDFILQSKKRGQEFLKPLYAPSILGRIRGLFDRLV